MIDARYLHRPELAQTLLDAAFNRVGSKGEVAELLKLSRRSLQMIYRHERGMTYGVQVQLEAIIRGDPYRSPFDQSRGPSLVTRAIEAAGPGNEEDLAARLDVTPRYLGMLATGARKMSYGLQCLLEKLLAEHEANERSSEETLSAPAEPK